MNKPIQLIIEETKNNIVNTINKAELPMCCISPILKDIYEQTVLLEKQQLDMAKEEFEKNSITASKEAAQNGGNNESNHS